MQGKGKRPFLSQIARGRKAVRRRVPPGWRWPLGVVLIALGCLGFLPILGFWMIPLGIAVAAMDRRRVARHYRKETDIP